MEKYQNKSKLMKFVHRNTGYIIAGVALAVIIPLLLSMQSEQYFFEKWSCEKINQYVLSRDSFVGFPSHDSISENEHVRLHQIINECGRLEMFPHD